MALPLKRLTVVLVALVFSAGLLVAVGVPVEAAEPSHPAWRCALPGRDFLPTKAQLPSLERTVKVIQVQREPDGQIGSGPKTEAGKWLMAMDPKTRPGSRRGSVLLSGHTWPDGSALGNAMLKKLWTGNGIVLHNDQGAKACYRVNRRKTYPRDEVPSTAFRTYGDEQVVIVACSGKRLGPGNWTHRTLWFATPWTPAPPPEPTDPPDDDGGSSSGDCLLCGILGN